MVRSPADRLADERLASKSCALNWDNHGCSHSGKQCLAERCRSLPRDAARRRVQGVVGIYDMDSIAGCFHLHSQKFPSRTARPERTGGCAAPAVLIPERFRIRMRCPFGGCALCARRALQSADRSLAVQEPERVWEVAPSVELVGLEWPKALSPAELIWLLVGCEWRVVRVSSD